MNKIRGQVVYSLEERLRRLSRLNEDTGCVEVIRPSRGGYGRLIIGSRSDGNRRSVSAHRLAYELEYGEIPEGKIICHSCDNRACINVAHLWVGTRQDNVDDRERKGRNNPPKGESHAKAKLTETQVLSARRLRTKGYTYQSIADRFGVAKKTILTVIKGETWKCVLPHPPKEGA